MIDERDCRITEESARKLPALAGDESFLIDTKLEKIIDLIKQNNNKKNKK